MSITHMLVVSQEAGTYDQFSDSIYGFYIDALGHVRSAGGSRTSFSNNYPPGTISFAEGIPGFNALSYNNNNIFWRFSPPDGEEPGYSVEENDIFISGIRLYWGYKNIDGEYKRAYIEGVRVSPEIEELVLARIRN